MSIRTVRVRRYFTLASALAALALCASLGLEHAQSQTREIVIGALLPMTGGNAPNGAQKKTGYELAIEEVNAQGGIKSLGGAKLKLIIRDHEGKAALTVPHATATLSWKSLWQFHPALSSLIVDQAGAFRAAEPHPGSAALLFSPNGDDGVKGPRDKSRTRYQPTPGPTGPDRPDEEDQPCNSKRTPRPYRLPKRSPRPASRRTPP